MSPQSASRGPVERGFVERIPCPDTEKLAASVGGLGRENSNFKIFVSFWKFQAGLCLHVTEAVKGGSLRVGRTWSQRPKFVQHSLESVATLAPFLLPFPPLSAPFWSSWGVPECNTQGHPSMSGVSLDACA